jgi:hypothetical protein
VALNAAVYRIDAATEKQDALPDIKFTFEMGGHVTVPDLPNLEKRVCECYALAAEREPEPRFPS